MTFERLEEIFESEAPNWEGDNAFKGCLILQKYLPSNHDIIQGARHDEIFGPDVEDVLKGGLTEGDAIELARLNWLINDKKYFSCFV